MADKAVRRNGRPQACEPCRQAKVACGRELPTCLRCKRRSMSLNCVYSSRGAARLSQAEQWAGGKDVQLGGLNQGWPVDQHAMMHGDDWMSSPNPHMGIDCNMPMDTLGLQGFQADPMFGMDPSSYSGSADATYMSLPQNQQELLNASMWDQQASLIIGDNDAQSTLMGGDPRMAPYYSQLQARGLPGAQHQVPMAGGSVGGMMNVPYMATQASQQQNYVRRAERR